MLAELFAKVVVFPVKVGEIAATGLPVPVVAVKLGAALEVVKFPNAVLALAVAAPVPPFAAVSGLVSERLVAPAAPNVGVTNTGEVVSANVDPLPDKPLIAVPLISVALAFPSCPSSCQ